LDLHDMNITVGQLLSNPEARKILAREFPTLVNSPLVRLYSNMSLKQVIKHSGARISQDKIQQLKKEIESI